MLVIDADVIIRFLTKDDLDKAKRFKRFLQSAKPATVIDVTIAEVFWTLKSFYHYPKQKILDALNAFISLPQIHLRRELLFEVIEILKTANISFIDAYVAAYSLRKHGGQVLSYDKGFAKVKGIRRVEP